MGFLGSALPGVFGAFLTTDWKNLLVGIRAYHNPCAKNAQVPSPKSLLGIRETSNIFFFQFSPICSRKWPPI